MVVEDVWSWSAGFDAFVGGFAARFPRVESRRQMRCHVRGLLSEVERKNGWALAEATGQSGPERMQRLLNFYAWDEDGVRDDLRAMVTEVLGDPESGVLIVDETGFLKKGVKSAGVARQCSGTAGRIENSQIGVFLAYASDRGRALVDRELYLPKEWTADRSRCREAGVGDEVGFATKQVLARRMLERAVDSGVPFAWVTADELYGMDTKFRLWMEGRDIAHVVAVPKSASVVTMWLTKERADGLIAAVPDENWQRLSCGDGVRGPKVSDWAVLDIRPLRDSGKGHWLLARRSLSDRTDIAYYVCFGPAGTSLAELVRVAGARWAVEECFQTAKNETGLDRYQVRGYRAWYRHVTLSMVAMAYLVVTRDAAKKGGPDSRGRQGFL
ncbi:IS701 family transposase [Actinosynnema pretiosum subsp. pretiosum]|uniref:IS701 family transposase n=1 Tax=Actinosynnema pretiosum subsp. pretiosum TaxID=103721 RepID=A0AA45LCH4_9PSEU|nr:Mobile element protein [Actinosynnema pretiosum subsp. pretiosum]QUF06733.1 IS701 family transposase [Actinosynnema pretiosum subsp. pretiosum]